MRLDDSELDELLGPMRDGPVALSGHAAGAARRERLLPGVRAAVRSTPQWLRRSRMLRRAGWGATVGGALLAALVVSKLPNTLPNVQAPMASTMTTAPLRVEALGSEPLTFVDAKGVSQMLSGDAPIAGAGELLAPASSWSRVLTARGARIELAPRARLRVTVDAASGAVAGGDPALRLEQGEAHFSVPHLGPYAHFSIATPDTQVIVHGTVFSVRVGPSPVSQTCVRVNEGLVEVRHHDGNTFLRPGMQWGCEDAATAQASDADANANGQADADDSTSTRSNSRAAVLRARARAARDLGPSGTLEQETALLAAALAAERDGDRTRARTLFSELLDRHPRSPLAPEARSGAARTR